MAHRILRILVGVVRIILRRENSSDHRRRVPQSGQEEVDIGAHHPGLGHTALGRRSGTALGQAFLEVHDDQVASVVHLVQVLVEVVDHLVAGVEAELVQLGHEVVVTEVGAGGIHIVTAVVEGGLVVRIDGTSILTGDAGGEAGISRSQSRYGILFGLVEVIIGGHTLLRDIQILLTGDTHHEGGESENRINYLFHIPYSLLGLEGQVHTEGHGLVEEVYERLGALEQDRFRIAAEQQRHDHIGPGYFVKVK